MFWKQFCLIEMEAWQRDLILRNEQKFLTSLNTNDVDSHLQMTHILSLDDVDEIDAEPTRRRRCAKLLELLLASKKHNAFDEFKTALTKIQSANKVMAQWLDVKND